MSRYVCRLVAAFAKVCGECIANKECFCVTACCCRVALSTAVDVVLNEPDRHSLYSKEVC